MGLQREVLEKLGRGHGLGQRQLATRLLHALLVVRTLVHDARMSVRGPEETAAGAAQGQDLGELVVVVDAVRPAQLVVDLFPVLDLAHLLELLQVEDGVNLPLIEVKAGQLAPNALLGHQLGHGVPCLGGRLQVPMVGDA